MSSEKPSKKFRKVKAYYQELISKFDGIPEGLEAQVIHFIELLNQEIASHKEYREETSVSLASKKRQINEHLATIAKLKESVDKEIRVRESMYSHALVIYRQFSDMRAKIRSLETAAGIAPAPESAFLVDFSSQTDDGVDDVPMDSTPSTSNKEVQCQIVPSFQVPTEDPVIDPPAPVTIDVDPVEETGTSTTREMESKSVKRKFQNVSGPTQKKSRISLTQCFNCQKFGHYAGSCTEAPKCVKCGGDHISKECEKPKDSTPRCSNCNGGHTSNYRGCPYYKEVKSKTLKARKEKKKRVPKPSVKNRVKIVDNKRDAKSTMLTMMTAFQQMMLSTIEDLCK